jgi:hypothetical protein
MRHLSVVLAALLLSSAAAVATAAAGPQRIYWTSGPMPRGIDRVTVRSLPGGTVLVPRVGREAVTAPGVEAIDVPVGAEAFVVRLPHGADDVAVLSTVATVLRVEGAYALLAADAAQAANPLLQLYRKERLTYLPPAPASVVAAAGRTGAGATATATTTAVDPQVKQAIVNSLNIAKWTQYVRELSGDLVFWLNGQLKSTNNRHITKPGILIAQDYMEDRLRAMGYTVIRQPFMVGGTPAQNIIGVKTGVVLPDEIIVVGSHHDSLSEDINLRAPGAEDDASGTAGVLHLAELLAPYRTERTIHFACFSGEEQGIYGSQYYVSQLGANGWHVTNAMVLDEISAWETNFAVVIEGQPAWEPLMSLYQGNLTQWAGVSYRKDYVSWGSDHVPFQQAGIPAFIAIHMDYPSYPYWESINDKWNQPCPGLGRACMDPALALAILKGAAATLADLAVPIDRSTPAPPAPVVARLALEQNVPNPFNPSTLIAFELAAPGRVHLDIYDAAGRRVRRLLDEERPAGAGSARWDGLDELGRAVASGLYHYRLITDDGALSRSMVLAR